MSSRRWFAEFGPVTATIDTGGQAHRVSWRAGRLVLHDHDVAAEQVLLALGGEPCPCLYVLDAFRGLAVNQGASVATFLSGGWQRRVSQRPLASPSSVTLTPTPSLPLLPAPSVPPTPTQSVAPPHRAVSRLQAARSDPALQRMPLDRRQRILAQLQYQVVNETVPGPMADILTRSGKLRFARRVQRVDATRDPLTPEQVLREKANAAMEQAMRQARGNLRSYAPLTVECWKAVAGAGPLLDGQLDSTHGWVSFALPVRWLNQVCMRGLACVDDHFVLDVDLPAPARVLRAQVVRWERQLGGHRKPVAAPCLIHRHAGEWRIAW